MRFIEQFIDDYKHYDSRNIEIKTILKYVKLKDKTVIDVGAGTGRLSFPLAKYAKKVIALDSDKRVKDFFNKHKKKNVAFVNEKAEKYLKKIKKTEVILLAWPNLDLRFLKSIKKGMNRNSLFIFITCDDNSDYETIIDKINAVKKSYFKKAIEKKREFFSEVEKQFAVLVKKKLSTDYIYANKEMAFRIIENNIKLWFRISLNKKSKEKLKDIIERHRIGNKIKFEEKIWFYLVKLRKEK